MSSTKIFLCCSVFIWTKALFVIKIIFHSILANIEYNVVSTDSPKTGIFWFHFCFSVILVIFAISYWTRKRIVYLALIFLNILVNTFIIVIFIFCLVLYIRADLYPNLEPIIMSKADIQQIRDYGIWYIVVTSFDVLTQAFIVYFLWASYCSDYPKVIKHIIL